MKPLLILLLVLLSATAAFTQPTTTVADVIITILADEITVASDLKTDLGFACLVESNGRSILFDTGSDGPILLANADLLRKDLSSISAVVISHPHTDHTGGLSYLLTSRASGIPVYIGQRYSRAFAGLVTSWNSRPVAVTDTVQILPGIYTSGELPGSTFEQVLVIDTEKGLVLITGCAHPGIARIVAHVRERFRKEVYLILGGLHLLDERESTIQETARQLKTLRVRKCAPTHCTGGTALAVFRKEFGADLIPAGVGSVLRP